MLPLKMGNHVKYSLPFNSKILSCGFIHGYIGLFVWYICDPEKELEQREPRHFHLFKTGDPLPIGIERINFIGTAQNEHNESSFVIHLFEGEIV